MELKEPIKQLQKIEQKITVGEDNRIVFEIRENDALYLKIYNSSDISVGAMRCVLRGYNYLMSICSK